MKKTPASRKKRYIVSFKKGDNITCPVFGCLKTGVGIDIEEAYNSDNKPIYAVYYTCEAGHNFIGEFLRNA